MQKSGRGLFQSLLYQILRSAPDLIIPTCKDRLGHEVWEMEDLREVYQRMAQQTGLDAKFCFFIDGLDEYDGEEKDIIQLLQMLSAVPHIKICVSSRPGRQYENLLRLNDRTIDIAKFTKEDMKKYISRNLEASVGWQRLLQSEPTCQEIIYELSIRAGGVWLWVFLVTKDIVKEADKSEGISTLRRIVNEFPDDLYEYFERMIERIPKLHREEMAQIFLVSTEAREPLPLYAFALLQREAENDNYAIDALIRPLTWEEVESEYPTWKSRLRNRCSDLLVVNEDERDQKNFSRFTVEFLHRTVRDFLREYDMQLRRYLVKEFDPLKSLCNICLGLIKAAPTSFELFRVNNIIGDFLCYALRLEERTKLEDEPAPVRLIDQLDMVMGMVHSFHSDLGTHWTNAWGPRGGDRERRRGQRRRAVQLPRSSRKCRSDQVRACQIGDRPA